MAFKEKKKETVRDHTTSSFGKRNKMHALYWNGCMEEKSNNVSTVWFLSGRSYCPAFYTYFTKDNVDKKPCLNEERNIRNLLYEHGTWNDFACENDVKFKI